MLDYQWMLKPVKYARIKVNERGEVMVTAPLHYSESDILALLQRKARWISDKQHYFANKERITLLRNQLLLFGNRYSYYYDSALSHRVNINHNHLTIQSQRDLLEPTLQEQWYKREAKAYMVPRTEDLAAKLKFSYHKLYIRSQKTKLGSCSSRKNISLNWKLIKAPKMVIDYVIIHELCHLKVLNHSPQFWTLLKSLYPDYPSAIQWLDRYGNSL